MLHSNLSYRRGVAMSKRLTRSIFVLAIVASLSIGVALAGAQNASNEFTATMKGSSEKPKGPSSASGTFTVQFKNGQACYKMSVKGARRPAGRGAHPPWRRRRQRPDRRRPQADVQGDEPAHLAEVRVGEGQHRE